ncbi:deoxynucleoside kinase [Mesoaciditoga lauensis]|uniref:deoxynucleoside kinase n=1 Tax=Mesoaciditoga lauensis TaxID=1495039 RepID=UPI000562C323|nr:deoxynucleoside kinase [Mesoaciditoga lauensis]
MYICVEGVIGVGKTTLARMISDEFGFLPFLEVVEENPFLANFYQDRERWAFQTQLFFLLSRYSQQNELSKILDSGKNAVSDYMFDKDRIFARMNLVGDQMDLYDKVFDILDSKVSKPDLILYLRASIETLMKRIAMRDRVFERNMDKGYISSLITAYDEFFDNYHGNFLTINANEVDFVQNKEDFHFILSKIRESGVEF